MKIANISHLEVALRTTTCKIHLTKPSLVHGYKFNINFNARCQSSVYLICLDRFEKIPKTSYLGFLD